MLSIELILTTGSKAGTLSPLQRGYYMIGRHAECQIRPKSRSVSRRHCLLHHSQAGLSVLDLRSTRGTRVNEEKIEPQVWKPLNDGDQIRCGKICFEVSIKQAAVPVAAGQPPAKAAAAPSDAWQETDIAQFLEEEDEADRERRYGQIRASVGASEAEDIAADDYEDTPLEKDDSTPVEADDQEVDKRVGKAKAKRPSVPRKKTRRKSREFSFSLPGGDKLKLMGAVLLVSLFLGFFAYQIYHFSAGPTIQVLEEID